MTVANDHKNFKRALRKKWDELLPNSACVPIPKLSKVRPNVGDVFGRVRGDYMCLVTRVSRERVVFTTRLERDGEIHFSQVTVASDLFPMWLRLNDCVPGVPLGLVKR